MNAIKLPTRSPAGRHGAPPSPKPIADLVTEIAAGRERASRGGKNLAGTEQEQLNNGSARAAGPRTCPRIARTVSSALRRHGPAGQPPRGAPSALRRETRITLAPPGPAARGADGRKEPAGVTRRPREGQRRTRPTGEWPAMWTHARARVVLFGRSIAGRPASEVQLAVPR
jgi:hypothetical protein